MLREGGALAQGVIEGVKAPETPDFEFAQRGGHIIERYPDGRPKMWVCGIQRGGEEGAVQAFDPLGAEHVWHSLATVEEKKQYGTQAIIIGHNPDESIKAEERIWNPDVGW